MNTHLAFDHAVIVVRDLPARVAAFEAAGFTVAPGGRHPGRNTRNALVVFADGAYLELIAYDRPSPEERWWRVLEADGEGLVDFALVPDDVTAMVAAARARGLQGLAERPGARSRPDGMQIAWQSARPATHDLPFLCADLTPRALRVPEGAVRQHANGALGIAEVQVAVADLPATLQRCREYLGPDGLDADGLAIRGARIRFVASGARARGDGPCGLLLRFAHGPGGERVAPLEAALQR